MTCVSRSAAKAGAAPNAIAANNGNPILKNDMMRSFVWFVAVSVRG
jgi:hypothetical protein